MFLSNSILTLTLVLVYTRYSCKRHTKADVRFFFCFKLFTLKDITVFFTLTDPRNCLPYLLRKPYTICTVTRWFGDKLIDSQSIHGMVDSWTANFGNAHIESKMGLIHMASWDHEPIMGSRVEPPGRIQSQSPWLLTRQFADKPTHSQSARRLVNSPIANFFKSRN